MKIEAGMFVMHGALSIYFEVESVHDNFVICASRDPKKETELVFISDIVRCVDVPPMNSWIKLDRTKGFYDKFHPEGWQPTETEVIPFSEIKAGMVLIGNKGSFIPNTKNGTTWHCTGAQKTLSSKNEDTYVIHLVQVEGYTHN